MVISVNGYLAILAALAAERLFELALSRRNARRALKMGAMEMGAGHYPVMAIFHALFVAAAAAEVIVFKRRSPARSDGARCLARWRPRGCATGAWRRWAPDGTRA
jgi:isoprenylcysteine carboxyl methyltransferase (ICMT) family protein YpbQ